MQGAVRRDSKNFRLLRSSRIDAPSATAGPNPAPTKTGLAHPTGRAVATTAPYPDLPSQRHDILRLNPDKDRFSLSNRCRLFLGKLHTDACITPAGDGRLRQDHDDG